MYLHMLIQQKHDAFELFLEIGLYPTTPNEVFSMPYVQSPTDTHWLPDMKPSPLIYTIIMTSNTDVIAS